MKTVYLNRDFYYQPHPRFSVAFKAGTVYARVLDAAADAIVRAGAGRVVEGSHQGPSVMPDDKAAVDAARAWTRYGGRVKCGRG